MQTLGIDLFGMTPWIWLLVPVLSVLLIQIIDQSEAWRESAVRIVGSTLLVGGCALLLFLAVAHTPW